MMYTNTFSKSRPRYEDKGSDHDFSQYGPGNGDVMSDLTSE